MSPKHIILWGGWYGSKNVGDQALLLSITDMLGESVEDVEFVVITANPARVEEYMKRDSIYSFQALHARRQFGKVVKAFAAADLFIFGGGVPFYDDISHSLAIGLLVTLARLFRVPCILWSVSSQHIRSWLSRAILRYLLSYASVVTCRDTHTHHLIRECSTGGFSAQIVADPAFTLRPNEDLEFAQKLLMRAGSPVFERFVALTPRALRGRDGEVHTHYSPRPTSDRLKEVEVFASVLDWLWENGYQPIFVPMNTVAPDDDRAIAREIVAHARYGQQALLIDEEVYPREAENVYCLCHAAFVARVHGSVMSFLGECPVMMYAFDLKHRGIMEQMGLSDFLFEPEQMRAEDAVLMMSRLLSQREAIQAKMRLKHIELVESARVPLRGAVEILTMKRRV
ncbi:MAG TPA: polysaccharide pyruvyl transferase family protein [Anaerolineales bacterium]|nr:polysaccharide pyruvyl transferase family protein [Anaerolineales bacterium]